MPDAPVEAVVADDHQSDEVLSPKSHPKPQPEAQLDAKEPSPPKTEAVSAVEPAAVESADAATKNEDVTMGGTEEPVKSSATTAPSEIKQETATSTDATTAPTGEAEASPKTTPTRALTPPPPSATSDTVQPSGKVSRERDIDSEDEPVAKRTKVEHADQVQVKTDPAAAGAQTEVDRKPGSARPSPQLAGGGRKKLDDASLDDTPITEWQNKQIRAVLAGVKKTKVGGLFRLPVQHLWPQLWADYSAKVTNPTDISTMEKRLRGDGPKYPTMGDFKRDLDLMVQNAVSFNGEGHDVTLQAKACREAILSRMAMQYASEPPKPEKKESAKAHPTRHAEPRAPAAAPASSTPSAPNRPPKPVDAAPAPKPPVPESPAFALPPGSNGVPLIRRDSTKPDSRAKRPVKPAHSKDLVYDTKRKKKLPLDLRFCDEVLIELRKTKHYDINAAFMQPVDPVALNIPHYHKVIKRPMDLQTMANKLAAGDYTNAKEFDKDFDLIIKNCKTFNGEDHLVYSQALRLQDLYRAEMSKKDEWMAKHAPVAAAAPHPPAAADRNNHHKDDSDSDDAESEADHEQDEERKQVENRVATILKRLEPEQKKLNEMVNSGTADMADVEITQSVVALLQKQLMGERAKLANLPAKKSGGGGGGSGSSKSKPAKSKKSGGGGGGGGASVSSKKAAVSGGGGGGAPAKRGGTKKAAPKKKISQIEKDIIVESLGNLDGPLLERAIDLIKKDTGQGENDAGELELDIDTVSDEALGKLYEIAIKANPNARAEKERQYGHTAAPQAADPPAGSANKSRGGPSSKSKKNKPMSKVEQERRIQQLNELRAQAARQGSGSQEPIESIEGPGGAAEAVAHESEDEVDSEED